MLWGYECGNCESTPCICESGDKKIYKDIETTNKEYLKIRNMKNIREYYDLLKIILNENSLLESWYVKKTSPSLNIEDLADEVYFINLFLKEKL